MSKQDHKKDNKKKEKDIQTNETGNDESAQPDESTQLKLQVEAMRAKWLQTLAEFDNYRKRMDDEKSKFGLMANRMFVDSILEVLDDVQMARGDENLDLERAKSLFETFTDKLLSTLKINGVERLEIQKGDTFDSSTMEAITTMPGDEDNKVIDVISGAYKYAGKDELLKTAKVVVSKKQWQSACKKKLT